MLAGGRLRCPVRLFLDVEDGSPGGLKHEEEGTAWPLVVCEI